MVDVLYEDNHIIAVNKPAGMLTQQTDEVNESLENAVKAWLKEKYQKPGNVFLGVVHRLDRPVSGIVLFAKTSKALSRINASIREGKMHKTYCAWVEGSPNPEAATLEHYLQHGDHRAHVCRKGDVEAKLARLHYTKLKHDKNSTLLKIILETGRYHQIRAQLSAIGHPIVGDIKYGSKTHFENPSIALQHTNLVIDHPVTKEALYINCPLIEPTQR